MNLKITKELIEAAQKSWGDGIVKIGKLFTQNADFKEEARTFILNHYDYINGAVLFKPTLAAEEQFRDTLDKALSYFIGGNSACPEDHGFAIKPWIKVRFENSGIIIKGETGIAMGNYFFTDVKGEETKVEYSFSYIINHEDEVKVILHHSSLPYTIDIE